MRRPNYTPSAHTRLCWVPNGTRKGVGIFCKGYLWSPDRSLLLKKAKELRDAGIYACVRKFQMITQITYLLLVEDGIEPAKLAILSDLTRDVIKR